MSITRVMQGNTRRGTPGLIGWLAFTATMLPLCLSGCGSSQAGFSPVPASLSITGSVASAQHPIAGAAILLYAMATSGDGEDSTPMIAKDVTTDASGRFSISGSYSCPSSSSQMYVVALGGTPDLQTNANAAVMGLLGTCGSLSGTADIHMNEITTVAAVSALAPFMKGYSKIGFSPASTSTFSDALNTANQLANFVTGAMPGPALMDGQQAPTDKMATLGNILGACINTGGGTAGDSSQCGSLFQNAMGTSSAPTNTVDAMMNIAQNPTRNVGPLYALSSSTATARPNLLSLPADWTLVVSSALPAPVFSPAPGTYNAAQTISLSDSNSSAKIYYTTDGTTPTIASKLYTGAFTLTASSTVRAVAVLLSLLSSTTTSATYTIIPKPTHVAFQTQPSTTLLKTAVAPAITVAVLDSAGKVIPTATNQVSLGFGANPGKATFSGTTTVAAVAGYATFSNISISSAGTGYTLVAASSGLGSATSAAFNIVLPSFTISVPSSSIVMGRSMTGTLTLNQLSSTGVSIALSASPTTNLSITPTVVSIAAGQTSGTFTLYGLSAGASSIVGTANGFTSSTVPITVQVPAASQSDAFADSVGVNIHLHYTNTPYYTNFPLIKSSLLALGIRHVRDGMIDTTLQAYYDRHNELGAAGIKGSFTTVPSFTKAFLQSWPNKVASSFEGYEYPNEYDTVSNWIATLQSFGPTLYNAGKTGPYANATVIGPSLTNQTSFSALGDMSADMDVGNLHNYYSGRNPGTTGWGTGGYGSIPWSISPTATVDGTKKIFVTETGYGNASSNANDVPEAVSAVYMPRLLLEHWNAGFLRTYLYELLSEGSAPYNDYGLLRADGSQKPAFTAVANLIALVSDKGVAFTPSTLAYTLSGADSSVHEVVLQKRDGSFYLALWIEKGSYDVNSKVTSTIPTEAVTLALSGKYGIASTYQFDATGAVTTKSIASLASSSLTLSDKLLLVRVVPK